MKKTHFITYAVFVGLMVTGILFGNFLGGCISGLGFAFLVLVTAGRRQAAKAGQRIDRLIQQQRAAAQKGGEDGD